MDNHKKEKFSLLYRDHVLRNGVSELLIESIPELNEDLEMLDSPIIEHGSVTAIDIDDYRIPSNSVILSLFINPLAKLDVSSVTDKFKLMYDILTSDDPIKYVDTVEIGRPDNDKFRIPYSVAYLIARKYGMFDSDQDTVDEFSAVGGVTSIYRSHDRMKVALLLLKMGKTEIINYATTQILSNMNVGMMADMIFDYSTLDLIKNHKNGDIRNGDSNDSDTIDSPFDTISNTVYVNCNIITSMMVKIGMHLRYSKIPDITTVWTYDKRCTIDERFSRYAVTGVDHTETFKVLIKQLDAIYQAGKCCIDDLEKIEMSLRYIGQYKLRDSLLLAVMSHSMK